MRHVFLVGVLVLAASDVSAQPRFVLVDLQIPEIASVAAINDQGQVVGSYRLPREGLGGPIERAFLWLPHAAAGLPAGLEDLGAVGGVEASSLGRGLNEAGQVVGLTDIGRDVVYGGEQNGFSWQAGDMDPLRPVTELFAFSWAEAVNELGEVVGSEGTGFACHPLLWLPAPAYGLPAGTHVLDPLPEGDSEGMAEDINDLGQVVGSLTPVCDIGGQSHAVLWLPAPDHGLPAGVHDLTAHLDGVEWAFATGINESGQIIGSVSFLGQFPSEPFLWQDGETVLLGTLPGETFASVRDINEAGQIVGVSGLRAFLWENGVMSDLNDLIAPAPGWQLRSATGINNRGQIVGRALVDGSSRAFRLDPAAVFADGFESGDLAAWSSPP